MIKAVPAARDRGRDGVVDGITIMVAADITVVAWARDRVVDRVVDRVAARDKVADKAKITDRVTKEKPFFQKFEHSKAKMGAAVTGGTHYFCALNSNYRQVLAQ